MDTAKPRTLTPAMEDSVDYKYSKQSHSQALKIIPGGVNSPVRSFQGVSWEFPVYIQKGNGSFIWDIDDNQYLDLLSSWGPLILGHAHPQVVEAINNAAQLGTSFGSSTEGELKLASLIVQAVPSIEMVRLVNSGTEATMSALRLARAYTNRSKIVKFNGCYHGHSDSLLVSAGSGLMTSGVPSSAGVPTSTVENTLVAEFNDLPSVQSLFDHFPEDIAGIILEPIAGNMGVVLPENGFLEGVINIAKEHNSLVIFDEVITGFRVAFGGAQELYDVTPDITCLGKIIGGGLPVGAYGRRKEIMEYVAPSGPMYQAGTLSGNPLAVSAGIATLDLLRAEGVYTRLNKLGSCLENAILGAAYEVGVHLTINRVGSMLTIFFHPGPVNSWAAVSSTDVGKYSKFFHGMLSRGYYLPPSAFECLFISLAHEEEDLFSIRDNAARVLSSF